MTAKLFLALYVGLIVGMIVLFFVNFEVAWIFFGFLFTFGMFVALFLMNRPYLIAAGFLLVSLVVMGIGMYGMQQSIQASHWPTTTGAITRSLICTRWVNGSTDYSGPCIEYTYTANGADYKASSIDTREFTDRGFWWGITGIPAQYRVDRAVTVYYNPANPGVSRLDPTIPARDWFTTSIGGLLAALSAFTLFWTAFKRSPNDTSLADFKVVEPIFASPHLKRNRDSNKRIPDIGDQLEKLAQLHKASEISDEEYEQAKEKLLGS